MLASCDTSVESEVETLLQHVRVNCGLLRVLVHAAGVLSDGLLPDQDAKSMRRVWGPKADGAWFLHKYSKDKDKELSAFIMYSSVASLFGNVGQANYSAANAYLDELAEWRVAQGLPGVTVQWPAVSGVGMAAAMDERVRASDALSVNVTMVKRVVAQLISGVTTASLAVVPSAMLEAGALPASLYSLVESVRVASTPRANKVQRSKRRTNSKRNRTKQVVEKVDRLPIYPSPIDDLLICFQPGDSDIIAPIVICIGLLGWIQGRGFMKIFPSSQPIYAMQAPELISSDDGDLYTVKERAWRFFQVLRQSFPTTGVHLFGSSFGGPLGAEIALFFQNAHVPFPLMMHDPLPPIAPPQPTDEISRRALDYGFLFSVLSRTKQLTEKTRGKVANVKRAWFDDKALTSQSVEDLDQAVKQLLGVEEGMFEGLMKTMAVMAKTRESLSAMDPKKAEVIDAPVTIFTMSEGGAFFADFFGHAPADCIASNGYGWSSLISDANIVQLRGGHLEGLGSEEAMTAVSQHIQKLVAAGPLEYKPVRVHRSPDSIMTRIELVSDSITDHMVDEILSAVEPGRVHVFSGACSDFCVGRSARAGFEMETLMDGIEASAKLLRGLEAKCDLPVATLCHGATRGIGALFAAVSDIVLATSNATFVLSEVGDRGPVPGIPAIALPRRLGEQQSRQFTQTGDALSASEALECGLIDEVSATRAGATQELERIVQVLVGTPVEALRARKEILRSGGNLGAAMVETGKALMFASQHDPDEVVSSNLVRTQWHANGVAVVELFDQEGEVL